MNGIYIPTNEVYAQCMESIYQQATIEFKLTYVTRNYSTGPLLCIMAFFYTSFHLTYTRMMLLLCIIGYSN